MKLRQWSFLIGLTLVAVLQCTSFGQVITEADWEEKEGQIVVHYLFEPQSGKAYSIRLLISIEGDRFLDPRNVTGDIGVVASRGRKTIVWDVLKERDSLKSTNFKVRIVADEIVSTRERGSYEKTTLLERIGEIVFGDLTYRNQVSRVAGVIGVEKTTFTSREFAMLIEEGKVSYGMGWLAGLRFGISLLTIRMETFSSEFNYHGASASDTATINHWGINIDATAALFPIARAFALTVGAGYQFSALYIGESVSADPVSRVSTGTTYVLAGANLVYKNLFVAADYKVSFGNSSRGWRQFTVTLGFYFLSH